MKKIFTFLCFLFYCTCSNAQIYVDGKPLSEVFDGKYISICPNYKGFNHYLACIDFGQEMTRRLGPNGPFITDENGEKKRFMTQTSLMNFMNKNGFDVFHISDSTTCVIYMRKE